MSGGNGGGGGGGNRTYRFTIKSGEVTAMAELREGRAPDQDPIRDNQTFTVLPDGSIEERKQHADYVEVVVYEPATAGVWTRGEDSFFDNLGNPLAGEPEGEVVDSGDDGDGDGLAEDEMEGDDTAEDFHTGKGADDIVAGGGDDSADAGDGDDFASGDAGDDSLDGGLGADTLKGGADDDSLRGGSDDDSLAGDDGDDDLAGDDGADNLSGGRGRDDLHGGADDDSLSGGLGDDSLAGDDGDDRLLADAGDDSASGGLGDDMVRGGDGADTLSGDDGVDVVDGGSGDDRVKGDADGDVDTYVGGTGRDLIDYSDDTGGVAIDLALSRVRGIGSGRDKVSGFEDAIGGHGDDRLGGTAEANNLSGGEGRDRIEGLGGNDSASGGAGDDAIVGGDGADTIDGGAGRDRMSGGEGADLFIFGAGSGIGDRIDDFVMGVDDIDLSGIDANAALLGDQAFTMVSRFSGAAGELTYRSGKLSGDVDGDGAADFSVTLTGSPVLTAGDIIL